jgi:hypothetical protein
LRQEEHPENVGLERASQLLLADVADVLVGMLLARVVDEDVKAAELIDRLPDGALAESLVPDVPGDRDRAAPFLFDNLFGLGGVVMLAQIEDRDIGALARE